MRRTSLLLVVLSLVVASSGPSHEAAADPQEIRWERVIGARPSKLDGHQRGRVAGILRREFCYQGCSRSIARCLEEPEPAKTAQRVAGFVIRQVLRGRSDEDIAKGIRNRALSAHPLQLATIDLDGAQCIGPRNAPILLVEYADFECPFCRVMAPRAHALVRTMRPNVRLCFKHFPVRGHDCAIPAATAAIAAGIQGRFWPMHDALYASAPRLTDDDLERCAATAGIPDMQRWNRDRAREPTRDVVARDKSEGLSNGVRGTPTFFVNRKQFLTEHLDDRELRDRLEEELDLLQGDP